MIPCCVPGTLRRVLTLPVRGQQERPVQTRCHGTDGQRAAGLETCRLYQLETAQLVDELRGEREECLEGGVHVQRGREKRNILVTHEEARERDTPRAERRRLASPGRNWTTCKGFGTSIT
ncbi:hypothetical protein NDU88_007102 [Pleurodeles waltl]|uniref:Uncharacterized protein n=1 Tax=Pleurodeles waltl TaxID=8319 RepID=A0AAV7MFY6_PLEWA|nr:hypothetical protein NDU88_007102 [Pleurodeles waltl]